MTKPKGTDNVAQSLIQAATDDYTSGRALSVRAVAQRAGVNHGQIHHIFGGKDGLKRAMLESLADAMDAQIAASEPADLLALIQATVAVFLQDERHVRALARQIVEDGPEQVAQQRFPVVDRLRGALGDVGLTGTELYLAEGIARGLGWVLFKDWIRRATGLSDDDVTRLEQRLADPMVHVALTGEKTP